MSLADGAYNWDNGTWTGFDGSSWVAASQEVTSYYLDPRNFLDEVSVFQFMNHKFDASTQTREGLQAMVQGTFLEREVILNGSAAGGTGTAGGSTGTTPGGGPGVVTSPGGGGSGPSAVLTAPQASVSLHKTQQVASSAGGVVVGVPPGSSGTSQNGGGSGQTTPGGGAQTAPGGASQPGSGQGSSTPVVTAPGPGGSQSGPGAGSSPMPGDGSQGGSYVDIIMRAAQQTGLNPYVIASMIIQEQGSNGQGRSISI